MQRLTHMIGALMLILMLWTGGVAQAADPVQAGPVTVEAVGHFDGDDDQVPADQHQGTVHHHGGCSDHHQGAAAVPASASIIVLGVEAGRFAKARSAGPSRSPENLLRPPIA